MIIPFKKRINHQRRKILKVLERRKINQQQWKKKSLKKIIKKNPKAYDLKEEEFSNFGKDTEKNY